MEDSKKYNEYNNLSSEERHGLLEINFYRFKHKLPLIEVPEYELNYHTKFAKFISEHMRFINEKN